MIQVPFFIQNIGLPGLLMVLVIMLIFVVPMWNLLPKFGYSKYISLVCIVPMLGPVAFLVLVWVLAFTKLPKESIEVSN